MEKQFKIFLGLMIIILAIVIIFSCTGRVIENNDFFKVTAKINDNFKEVLPGEEVLVEVQIQFLGNSEPEDIYVTYTIKDQNETILGLKSETLAVQTRASTINTLYIPTDTKPGKYTLYVDIKYNDFEARANDSFEVVENKSEKILLNEKIICILLIAVLISLLCLLILLLKEIYKLRKKFRRKFQRLRR